jgi:hypothetical protein
VLLLECDLFISHKGLGHEIFAFNRQTRLILNNYSQTADKGSTRQHGIKIFEPNKLNKLFVIALTRGVKGIFSSEPHDRSVQMNLFLIAVVRLM